ncbi:hypothetical protein HUG10_10315 [Halorarum halophilum]|uniref:DUF8056 domain-containing protein n=1 Tax=Halorarum halophilum TaxID=2743090 RepID=A0A7D5KMV5_9EURY|nr:hypothetical protein [Halobaculum halophilum]QLG27922.1 hypothetical protein HUG10_10315 [Halobaculum halophilum]
MASETGAEDPTTNPDERTRTYGGVFGAFPYAFRASDSWLFRSYVVVGGAVAVLLTLVFALALVRLFGATAGARFSVVRAFFFLVGLAAVAPTIAPVLLVARSRRRGFSRRPGYEAGLAIAGYLFVLSLYLGLVAGMPEAFTLDGETITRPPPSGPLAPVVAFLYGLPQVVGWLIPVLGAALVGVVHWLRR